MVSVTKEFCGETEAREGSFKSFRNRGMIRNESEYQEASRRLADEKQRIDELGEKLRSDGEDPCAVKRLTDPLVSFHLQLREEVESYQRTQ